MPGTPGPAPYDATMPAPAGGQPALAYLDLTVQGNRFTSNMIPPHVTVNGHPLVSEYGYRRVPVPAGPVRIDVECRWTKTFGQASMVLDVAPGQAVPVFYAAPATVFSKGKIGHTPQKRTGTTVLLVVLGVAIVVPVVIGIVAAFASS